MTLKEITHYRYVRDYGFFQPLCERIELVKFKTLRETKQGYWIGEGDAEERFVLKDSRKRYAYPTKKEAFNSFKIRTRKSAGYAQKDLDNARRFLDLIDKFEENI